MDKKNLIVLLIVIILLGISTGFISIDLSNIDTFLIVLLGILYTYWMGGPGGNSGTGNGENSVP